MEKYSSFRDPGTGIQPFLPPVAAAGESSAIVQVLYPVRFLVATVRMLLVALLVLLHVLINGAIFVVLFPLPSLRACLIRLSTFLICRTALLVIGFLWIPVDVVNRKKGRAARRKEMWSPKPGDIIISNWSSWVDVVWLTLRFNPQFIVPVCSPPEIPEAYDRKTPSGTPGRRTKGGSAAVSSPSRSPAKTMPVLGFKAVSFLTMLRLTGKTPPYNDSRGEVQSLEELQQKSQRPLALFPECTTSNCRGLLRFADVFHNSGVSTKPRFNLFLMCIRYDPPTQLTPTLSQSIPTFLNPLGHVFTVSTTLSPLQLSIRLLAPSESPTSPVFLAGDHANASEAASDETLTEACAALVAQTGKMKRIGLGWEDKAAFFEFRAREHQMRRS